MVCDGRTCRIGEDESLSFTVPLHRWTQQEGLGFVPLLYLFQRPRICQFVSVMIFCVILIGIQLLVALGSIIRESGEDERFQGDKLQYRS